MPDLTRTIEILFEGTNRTGTAIKQIGGDLDELAYRTGTIAQPFADLTTNVAKLDAALLTLTGAGLAAAYVASTKFEAAYTELKKVVGDNIEGLDIASKNAVELSDAYGESAASILESTASYVQAGFDVQSAMLLAKTGMDLVIAGGVDAATSSEILIAALKGFKAPAEEAGRLLDILNEVSNNYATDVEQLGVGMAALSPIASTMGFSMEETAGVLTPVIEVFRSGGEAAVALKTGLLKLIDDSKPVQEALASIGVSQRDANGELRSGKDILNDVANAFVDLNQDQKLFVTQQLVGINQSARMVTVFDGLAKSSAVTATALEAAGSASLEVAARLQTSEVALNRWVAGLTNAAIAVGDKFRLAATESVDGMTDIFSAIRNSVNEGDFDPLFEALEAFGRDLGKTFRDIAENIPEAMDGVDFSGFLDSLGDFREVLGGIFDDVDFTKPEDLTRVVQRVVDSLGSLVDFSSGVAEVFVTVAKKVVDLIDNFNDLDGDTKQLFGSISGFGSVVSMITGPVASLGSAITGLGSVMNVIAAGQVANLVRSLVGTGGLQAALTAVSAHPLIAAGVAGVAMGTIWRKMVPEVDAAAQSVLGFIDKYTGLIGVEAEHQRVQAEAEAIQERWSRIMAERAEATEQVQEKDYQYYLGLVEGSGDAVDSTKELTEQLRELGVLVEEKKTVDVDTKDAKAKLQELQYFVGEGDNKVLKTIKVPVDTSQVDAAKEKIEEAIPAEKRLEIETDLEVARLQAQSEVVQAALEWEAKVDIARFEADAEKLKAVAANINDMFANTGDVISGIFDNWDQDTGLQEKWALQESLRNEQERRDAILKMQQELTKAQIAELEAKKEAYESGEALIKVEGSNVSPHIEAFIWEILSVLQIRATQEGRDALLLGA